MCTDSAVGRLQVEHRLASFLSQGHEATVVFEQGQTMRIVCNGDIAILRLTQHCITIHLRDTGNPTIVSLYRTIEPYRVLQDNIPYWVHATCRELQVDYRALVQSFLPLFTP